MDPDVVQERYTQTLMGKYMKLDNTSTYVLILVGFLYLDK